MGSPFLSKSRFIKGLQCHKALWLTTHRPELKTEVSEQQQAVFDSGHEVGKWAQKLFPGGMEVPFDGYKLSEQVALTKKLIKDGVKTIYEAVFSHDNVFVQADILHRGKNGWTLGEVKSGTSFKDVYLDDMAIQFHVISSSGLNLTKAMLLLIDTEYVREGEIEPDKLFKFADLTEDVLEAQERILEELEHEQGMLVGPEPAIDIGLHCHDPYDCDFMGHCWAHIPEKGSVFEFAGLGRKGCFALYEQGYLRMEDVPLPMLRHKQRQQVECLNKQEPVVDQAALKEFLDGLVWPLAFLDFETTFMTPIPLFDGTSPYQAVPFQFSLHVQDEQDGELRHLEFLFEDGNDPRPDFIEALLSSVPTQGSVIVWNQGFESGIIKKLSEAFPEASEALLGLRERLVDLMVPFRQRSFYRGAMNGSYSIKAVLPALVPECSYKTLEIQAGDVAASTWLEMTRTDDQARKAHLRDSLLKYCELDTLAMVKILEKVREAVETPIRTVETIANKKLIEEFTKAELTPDEVKIRVLTISWEGPHTPKSQWETVATLPLGTDGMAERKGLILNTNYFQVCTECKERNPIGWMHGEVCQRCAESNNGIAY